MSKKEVVIPKGQEHYYEQYHFAPAVKDGNRLYCSGVIGVGPDGKLSSDPETQFGSVAKLIVTLCYIQLVVFFTLTHFNIWYSS